MAFSSGLSLDKELDRFQLCEPARYSQRVLEQPHDINQPPNVAKSGSFQKTQHDSLEFYHYGWLCSFAYRRG